MRRLMSWLWPWPQTGPKKRTKVRRAGRPVKRWRRGTKPLWRRLLAPELLLRRGTAMGILLVAALLGTAWAWQSGWAGRQAAAAEQGFYALTLRAGLSVENVLVEGRRRSKRSAVLDALDVARGVPILGLDPHAAKARLEDLPWVYRASVVRRLPETVYVRLVEREPLALWQINGELAVIDRSGGIIPGAQAGRFAKLPLVVGEDAAGHAAELLAMLAKEPVLKAKVAAAVLVRGRRWNVRLDGGIDVRLPEQGAAAAWAQLARIQREHGVLDRDVVLIDLRMPDRLVVRTAPGAADKDGVEGLGKDT